MTRRNFVQAAGAAGVLGTAAASVSASQAAPATRPAGDVPLAPPDQQPPDLKVPDPSRKKAGYAIVGLGQLALEEVMPAFAEARHSAPAALVSGHRDKAMKVAAEYGIKESSVYGYDTFDAIADNDEVQIVYVILPNTMHAEYTIRGHKAGKHVLCEKPMAPTAADCERMIAAADEAKRQLMIAYRLHYEPYNQTVMDLCEKRAYGPVKTFSAVNGQTTWAPNIRLSRDLWGGPVQDIGVYCINAARYTIREEPVEVTAFAHFPEDNPEFREVPESVAFSMRFPGGAVAHCSCSFRTAESRRYRVDCEKGFIDLDPAFSYTGLKFRAMEAAEKQQPKRESMLTFPQKSQFALQMDHLSQCILTNKSNATPGAEGLADIRVINAVVESYENGGRPVRVG